MGLVRDGVAAAAARVRRGAAATATAARRTGRTVRRFTHASGAGRTGLADLIEISAVNGAGDALVAVALAGTLFFGVPVDQARSRVALYLLVTMAPFAVVAPFVGPALDRARPARRFTVAATMLARGLLCWGMAGAVLHQDAVTLLPAAFGTLVLSKAFGVCRSAVTPRVLPGEITLVTANARCSLAGLIAATVAAAVAAGLGAVTGPDWVLRVGTVIFLAGAVLGLRLPRHVDALEVAVPPVRTAAQAGDVRGSSGPGVAAGTQAPGPDAGAPGDADRDPPARSRPPGRRWTLPSVGPVVAEAIQAGAALRAFFGFTVVFCAFLLRVDRFAGLPQNVALGVLAAAAGAGGLAGTSVGAWMRARVPHAVLFGALTLATVAAAVGAVFFGLVAAVGMSFVAAFGQALGKLGVDAIVQREVGEEVRSATFAVSETLHQLAWVVGGLAGLALSLAPDGTLGLALIAGALAAALVALSVRRARRRRRQARRDPTASVPAVGSGGGAGGADAATGMSVGDLR